VNKVGLIVVLNVLTLGMSGFGMEQTGPSQSLPAPSAASPANSTVPPVSTSADHVLASKQKPKSSRAVHSKEKKRKDNQSLRSRRVLRLNRAFVASADLQPMAVQLVEARSSAAYAGVEAYARKHAQTDAGGLAWLALGYSHYLDHDYPNAIEALKRAQANVGDLREYADYYLAGAYAAAGKSEAVVAALHDFDLKYPDSLLLRDAIHCYATALTATGHSAEAIRVLQKYRKPARADMEYALGHAYEKNGDLANAAEALQRVYYEYPLSAQAAAARSDLDAMTPAPAPASFAERKMRADLLAEAHKNAEAAREYRALLDEAPPAQHVAIQVALGMALYRSGSAAEARSDLESVGESSDETNALRWLTLAEMARSAEDESAFSDALDHLRQKFSASENFEQALMLGGNMYLLRKNYDRAIDHYRELQQRFPNSRQAAYAHWKAAWLTARLGRKEECKREFEEQVTLYPHSPEVSAAMYWRARLAEDDGDMGRARAWYQKLTYRYHQYYYAELARARLAILPATAAIHDVVLDAVSIPGAPYDLSAAGEPPADNLRYRKSLLLHNGGMTDLAVRELRAAAPEGTPWVSLQVARYYQQDGLPNRALAALKGAVPSYTSLEISALPRFYWETLFPRPYWDDLKKYAQENDLDPYLVASLIRQESEFNPGAVSRADALGLMQLLPKTGRKVARELHVGRFSTDQLLAPDFNLQLGTRYFREMVDQFGGRLEYALAAYNAGSDRVQDWMANGVAPNVVQSPEEFVESIPFTETREYVQAILRNAAIYKRLYGTP
jgi:soluble lytic murein transglycosylase